MAETIIKGTITSVSIIEGDTDKGHWMRQDCVIVPENSKYPIHFQAKGDMYKFVQGQSYVVKLYLNSRKVTNRGGQPIWIDNFICSDILTELHSQYYEDCMYRLGDRKFKQDYQIETQRRYTAINQPQGYVQQAQMYQPMQQPQGYGNQYAAQQQPYQQPVQGNQSNLPF